MFGTLFENLHSLHKQTALLEIMGWEEERVEKYAEKISETLAKFRGDSVESLIDCLLEEATLLYPVCNLLELRLLLEEEVKDFLKEIASNPDNLLDN
jgi:hypothetical protein